MRNADIRRETAETRVSVALTIEGAGRADIDTGCGFLDHMLTLLAHHGRFDLSVQCAGDTRVDDHHTVEDVGIALGQAFSKAVGDARGIRRYASLALPMDEALALCALDISGRAYVRCAVELPAQKVGTFDTELVPEFFMGFARGMPVTVHFQMLSGTNTHHIIEAMFKGFGRALREALSPDAAFEGEVPSSKGML